MPGSNASKSFVGIVQLGIKGDTEIIRDTRRETRQGRMRVDRNGVVITRDYGSGTDAVDHWLPHASAAVGEGGEESLQLDVTDIVDDLAGLVTITNMGRNSASEVVLDLEGVDLLILPQQIGPIILDDIG